MAAIFEQHPEFFKSYAVRGEQRVLLRWRYAQSVNGHGKDNGRAHDAAGSKDEKKAGGRRRSDQGPEPAARRRSDRGSDQHRLRVARPEAAAARPPDRYRTPLMAVVGAALGSIGGGLLVAMLAANSTMPAIMRIFD